MLPHLVPIFLGARAFNPSQLFAGGAPGAWYDFTDLSTMFQDSAGTTPVTGVEQAVGLILDKSRGLAIGPELVTNGNFSNGTTGWTTQNGSTAITVTNGEAELAAGTYAQQSGLTFAINKTYLLQFLVRSSGGVSPRISICTGNFLAGEQVVTTIPVASYATQRLFTAYFTPSGAKSVLVFKEDTGAGGTMFIDNISVREIAGTHAIQASSASRPVLRNRYNLLTWSEDFSNAIWQKLASGTGVAPTTTNNYAAAPDGTTTAIRVQFDLGATPATAVSRIFYNANDGRTALRTKRVWLRTNDSSTKTLYFQGPNAGEPNITVTGTWAQFVVADTSAQVAAYSQLQFGLDGSKSTSNSADILVWHPEIVLTADAAFPYQRIEAATVYDSDATKFPLYLAFDGSDDSLYTAANLDLSGTDKVTVFAGVTKLSDAATGMLAELTADAGTTAGGIQIRAPNGAAANYLLGVRGASFQDNITATTYSAPVTNALTLNGNLGGAGSARVDAVNFAGAGGTGGGNFASAVLNIGRRNNASLPFNGRLHQLIVRGAQSSAAEIASTERYVAGKQGRAL
ncbi:MAG: uncultured phage MedDCM-OCT-S45-C18 [Pseudomonadota bacterium]|jgi:hypothetical protein